MATLRLESAVVETKAEIHRVQTEADYERLHALLLDYDADLPATLRHGVPPDTESLRNVYSEPNAAFLAVIEWRPAGCIAAKRLDASTAVVLRLFVTPEHRGRGAARALVDAALDFVRERGYARVVLDTDKEQLAAAYELYRSLGFVECEPYGTVDYATPTFMELRLR